MDDKTVMIMHFDSGREVIIDLDTPDIHPEEAAKKFQEAKFLEHSNIWIKNFLVPDLSKIEYFEFKKILV